MINLLSYIGISLQSEVCLWTLVGLIRNIFDATLFKTNANLKQVWQMTMPDELSCVVQRILRTMISGVMLVQCFTVYVFLAAYIVLLYPVFLEERPTLVLPWLLLAAIRRLLCELMSLAMGLGVCLLLGPARTACIKFVIKKIITIMPYCYMWMLVFSYYHALKIRSSFKTFSVVLPAVEHDYGLELAVRRRRTKSLLDEAELRKKLVARLYGGRTCTDGDDDFLGRKKKSDMILRMSHSTETDMSDLLLKNEIDTNSMITTIPSVTSDRIWASGTSEEFFNSEFFKPTPRDVDRVLDQFTIMMLRIGAYIKNNETPLLATVTSSAFLPPHIESIQKNYDDFKVNDNTQSKDKTIRNDSYPNDTAEVFERSVNLSSIKMEEQNHVQVKPTISSESLDEKTSAEAGTSKTVSIQVKSKPGFAKKTKKEQIQITKFKEFPQELESQSADKVTTTSLFDKTSTLQKSNRETTLSEIQPTTKHSSTAFCCKFKKARSTKPKIESTATNINEEKHPRYSERNGKSDNCNKDKSLPKEIKPGHLHVKCKTTLKITKGGKNVVEKTLHESSADISDSSDIDPIKKNINSNSFIINNESETSKNKNKK